jgi:diadenosine tetraphosphate (Ap4A) HIT family hydrolase
MPTLISREDAVDRIRRERGDTPCLMCGIVERKVGDVHVLYEDDTHLVNLPRYVRKWGQVTITPKVHVTRYADVDAGVWARTNELAHQTARIVERARNPRRVIVASTGSSAGELVNSSVHLHLHVVPLSEASDRPASAFSWREGVYVGEPDEWQALLESYRALW